MASTSTPTPVQRLADLLLADAGPLESFVRTRRATTPRPTAWRQIARDLEAATGGEVVVTPEAIRLWFPDEAVG